MGVLFGGGEMEGLGGVDRVGILGHIYVVIIIILSLSLSDGVVGLFG